MHETFSKQIMKTRKEFYAQSLTFIRLYYTIIRLQKSKNVPVAQLDRVFDYESKGRGFESLLAHQDASNPNRSSVEDEASFLSDFLRSGSVLSSISI